MSAEEVGAYIRLLCYQWGKGSIPTEPVVLERIAGVKVSSTVVQKFPDGKNARLEEERSKQVAWRAKCASGGRKSAELRKGSSRVVATTLKVSGQVKGNSPLSTLHSPNNTATAFEIPSKLQTPEFEATWSEWLDFRSKLGKTKNLPALFSKQLKWLSQFTPQTASEIINSSIRNGYQGLFEPRHVSFSKPHTDRNAGTANEGKADQYANVGKLVSFPPRS